MGNNDCIVLDGIIKDIQKKTDQDVGVVFEKFAVGQILKDYALTDNQIDDGFIDGSGDGGIDGLYVVINGYPYGGEDGFMWPRENAHIEVWVITSKHREGFQEAPLASMYMTLNEFWDCGRLNDELNGAYSDSLLEARLVFLKAYKSLAHLDPLIDVKLIFVSRGDTSLISDAIKGRMTQLEEQAKGYFSKISVSGHFIGSSELLQLYRKVKQENLAIPFDSSLSHDDNNYVIITKISDYYDFVKDNDGKLRRYLFDSNVRDFLGYNNVNIDIDETLKHPSQANFWWLNNGITILCNNAHVTGRTLHLSGVQIVNGLQTTETIYRHFAAGYKTSLDKNILIKVLISQDEGIRKNIIQATNNQSNVMSYSLNATDDVQRNIEEVLRRDKIYYERRDRYYKNEGMPPDRFITPLELAKAFLAIVNRNPAEASGLKNRFMRNKIAYDNVFNSDFPADRWSLLAELWLRSNKMYYRVDGLFGLKINELNVWLPLVSFCSLVRILAKFDYTVKDIRQIKIDDVDDKQIIETWECLRNHFGKYERYSRARLRKPKMVYDLILNEIACKWGYPGVESCNKIKLIRAEPCEDFNESCFALSRCSDENVESVSRLLPQQPWKPGVHVEIARRLKLPPRIVRDAIDTLISQGRAYAQKDGVVYDADGKAILIDNQRNKLTLAELNAVK